MPTTKGNPHDTQKIYPFARQGNFTVMDNWVLDDLMPRLSPNVWKVLCYIIRQTTGWQRESVELTYPELLTGTGIGSRTTLSSALKDLATEGLITVADNGHWEANTYTLNTDFTVEVPSPETVPLSSTETVPEPSPENGLNIKESLKERVKENGGGIGNYTNAPEPTPPQPATPDPSPPQPPRQRATNTAAAVYESSVQELKHALDDLNEKLPPGDRFTGELELAELMAGRGVDRREMVRAWRHCNQHARSPNGAFLKWMKEGFLPKASGGGAPSVWLDETGQPMRSLPSGGAMRLYGAAARKAIAELQGAA